MESLDFTPTRREWVVLGLMATILVYQLLMQPIVGLANNGDFEKIMGEVGLKYAVTLADSDRYFGYINTKFLVVPRNWWKSGLITSERLLVEIALLVNGFVSKGDIFDIRILGAVHTGAFLVGIWLILVGSRRLGKPSRYVLAFLLLFVLTDVGYVSYFNSIYCEPASLVFLCLTVGAMLLCVSRRQPDVWLLILYFVAAMLFAAAKTQNSVLGFPLAVYGVRLSRGLDKRRWKGAVYGLALGFCLLCVVLFLGWRPYTREANLYNVVFYEILRNSPSPQEDLRELGLSEEFAKYAGTYAYMKQAPMADLDFRASFFGSIGYGKILRFYANHPSRLISLADRAMRTCFSLRPDLGNFAKSTGFPRSSKSQAFDQWSGLRVRYFPGALWFLLGFLGFNAGGILIAIERRRFLGAAGSKAIPEFMAVLVIMVAVQFFAVIIAEGDLDLVRHMFLFNVLFDWVLMLDLVFAAEALYTASRRCLRIGGIIRRSQTTAR